MITIHDDDDDDDVEVEDLPYIFFFFLFVADGGWTDKWTDGRTDKADASKNNNYVDSFADDVDDNR